MDWTVIGGATATALAALAIVVGVPSFRKDLKDWMTERRQTKEGISALKQKASAKGVPLSDYIKSVSGNLGLPQSEDLDVNPEILEGQFEMYKEGTKVVLEATKRLLIVQRTPTLLFDPRGGEEFVPPEANVAYYEKRFASAIEMAIQRAQSDKSFEFYYLYSYPATKSERNKLGTQQAKAKVLERLKELKAIEMASDHRFRFESIDGKHASGPLAISEKQSSIWLGRGENAKDLTVRFPNRKMARELTDRYLSLLDGPKTLEKLIEELSS